MRAIIQPTLTALLTSPGLRDLRRAIWAGKRRWRGTAPRIDYFHQPDDPYSHLAVQVLPLLTQHYDVEVRAHLVAPPAAEVAPDRDRLTAYARRDAALLAKAHGLDFPDQPAEPTTELLAAHTAALAEALAENRFSEGAIAAGKAFWRGNHPALSRLADGTSDPGKVLSRAALEQGTAMRARLGHYLGAMFHCEGEWYWGLDRLPALFERLDGLALRKSTASGMLPVHQPEAGGAPRKITDGPLRLDFFASLRSPYTYLAAARARALATAWGADFRIQFVLPMVMRGLPVPRVKRIAIVLDAKREAERLGLPFGRICDPVGLGVERGLAVLDRAIMLGKGADFLQSFLAGVFAEGRDATSPKQLLFLAARAGLTSADVDAALQDNAWRSTAEANRQDLLRLGLWGVPSFQVNDLPAHWGQDRLWAVEQDLRLCATPSAKAP